VTIRQPAARHQRNLSPGPRPVLSSAYLPVLELRAADLRVSAARTAILRSSGDQCPEGAARPICVAVSQARGKGAVAARTGALRDSVTRGQHDREHRAVGELEFRVASGQRETSRSRWGWASGGGGGDRPGAEAVRGLRGRANRPRLPANRAPI
jgi:hypothetical protein